MKTPALVPVRVTGALSMQGDDVAPSGPRTGASAMEVGLSWGRSIRVGVDFDAGAVARLVTTLEQLGC